MKPVGFKPSDCPNGYGMSSFKKAEKEAMASNLVTFLAANGDAWDVEIEWTAFLEHTDTNTAVWEPDRAPFRNPFYQRGCVAALNEWLRDGHLIATKKDGDDYVAFKVGQPLIDFYGQYARASA